MSIGSKRLSLRGLRLFCVAARHGSFRIAAEELFVSSSAVSHQIKSLETELRTALFQRKAQSLELTDQGARLFEEIDPLIRQIDAATRRIAPHTRHSPLRISVQPFFASEMFVPRLSEFTRSCPTVDIHIDTSDESRERHAADVDVSVRPYSTAPPNLLSDRLFSLRLVPAASTDFNERWPSDGKRPRDEFPIIVHADNLLRGLAAP